LEETAGARDAGPRRGRGRGGPGASAAAGRAGAAGSVYRRHSQLAHLRAGRLGRVRRLAARRTPAPADAAARHPRRGRLSIAVSDAGAAEPVFADAHGRPRVDGASPGEVARALSADGAGTGDVRFRPGERPDAAGSAVRAEPAPVLRRRQLDPVARPPGDPALAAEERPA